MYAIKMDRNDLPTHDWDRYSARYNPETVMAQFDRHLIQPALRNGMRPLQVQVGWRDHLHYLRFKLSMKPPLAFLREPTP